MKIFVAGSTGVIGQRLLPRLVQAGHEVIGMIHDPQRKGLIESWEPRGSLRMPLIGKDHSLDWGSAAGCHYPSAHFVKPMESGG